jgi:DNA-binding response OmpR family regulator
VKKNGEPISLTPKEWKILSALVKYPQKVFTRDDLLGVAFDVSYEGNDRVIDTHIKNLRKKIEDDPQKPVYVKTVHGLGYRFGDEKQ